MIVVVGALGFRSACLVGIAIPGSFLAGILVLAMGGLTVNIVVLFGLILAVGMLVDGAIVVTRSEEHTSELQSLMRISYAVFCLKKQLKPSLLHANKKHTHI